MRVRNKLNSGDIPDAISAADLAAQLRLTPAQAGLSDVTRVISAVTAYAETAIRQLIIQREVVQNNTTFPPYYRQFPDTTVPWLRLMAAPYVSMTSITYFDTNEIQQTLDLATVFIDDGNDYARVLPQRGRALPTTDCRYHGVELTYQAGLASDTDSVPADLKMAMLQHASALWANRGDCEPETCSQVLPSAAQAVYQRYRIHRLTGDC